MKRAVLYLRVSTPGQVQTDYDPEGISIPAQRKACERRAMQLDVEIVDEYVEPGRSATTIEKRPVFQAMMERLKTRRDVDYVIVYNLSRLNRNRVDDAKVLVALRACGVTLISAQENIDETPAGQLMHGILAAFNEYRSTADGADIRYKMGQKVKNGGSVGPAKLGYLNVRDKVEGREIRTIAIDPDRAPLVRMAFELFATGEFTVVQLAEEMGRRGLTTRATLNKPEKPISRSKLAVILRDRYYLGLVNYQGEEYPGRHEPIVDQDLFDRVQTVMDSHSGATVRQRVHNHYLKGSLWCGKCHERGIDSRLIVQSTTNRHGSTYLYFFCRGRQQGICDANFQQIADVEGAVLAHYQTITLPSSITDKVERRLTEALADEERATRLMAEHLRAELATLDRQEENLLDLAAGGDVPHDKIRERIARINARRAELTETSLTTGANLARGAEVIRGALKLLGRADELYRQADDVSRRMLNLAIFKKLYVYDNVVTGDVLAGPFNELAFRRPRATVSRRANSRGARARSQRPAVVYLRPTEKAALLERALSSQGSSKAALVDQPGIEPGSVKPASGLLRAQPRWCVLGYLASCGTTRNTAQSRKMFRTPS